MVFMAKFVPFFFFFVKIIDSGSLEHHHSWLSEASGGFGAFSESRWQRLSECALVGERPWGEPLLRAQGGLERAFWDLVLPLWPWMLVTGELSGWARTKGTAPCDTQAQVDASSASGEGERGGGCGESARGAALSGAPSSAVGVTPAPVGLGPQLRGTTGTIRKQRRGRRAPSEERPRSSLELRGQ